MIIQLVKITKIFRPGELKSFQANDVFLFAIGDKFTTQAITIFIVKGTCADLLVTQPHRKVSNETLSLNSLQQIKQNRQEL